MNYNNKNILSVTQVSNQVKSLLERKYCDLWIKAEISSCKIYPSGHIYLLLKDEKSELPAVIFSQYVSKLNFKPVIGQKVTMNGSLSLYTSKGKFQFYIKNLYHSGRGELWLAYEKLKEKLMHEGLFSNDNKKSIVKFPHKVAIITSKEGAVLKDILQVLHRRAPYVRCLIYPVPVQGIGAVNKIKHAIDFFNNNYIVNTIILARGGGSLEDLWCFNDEGVVRTIYSSSIPIISAIGHETDVTLSDYVSDLRAPTPSAAAELVAEDKFEAMQMLDLYIEKLRDLVINNITINYQRLARFNNSNGFYIPKIYLKELKYNFYQTNNKFRQSILNYFNGKNMDLQSLFEKLKLLNPNYQLDRGYSITTDLSNNILFSSEELEVSDQVKIQLSNGKFIAKVKKKFK